MNGAASERSEASDGSGRVEGSLNGAASERSEASDGEERVGGACEWRGERAERGERPEQSAWRGAPNGAASERSEPSHANGARRRSGARGRV